MPTLVFLSRWRRALRQLLDEMQRNATCARDGHAAPCWDGSQFCSRCGHLLSYRPRLF